MEIAKLQYKGEIWGRVWEAITWDKEERQYQHLTNALFMAAKADIIAEKHSNKGKYSKKEPINFKVEFSENETENNYTYSHLTAKRQQNEYYTDQSLEMKHPYTENLDKFIEQYIPGEATNEDMRWSQKFLKADLLNDYNKLKNNLADIRVLGVGNSNLQACAKACKILLKTMVTIAILPIIAASSLAFASPASPAVTIAAETGLGAMVGEGLRESIKKSVELAIDRSNFKESLKANTVVAANVKKGAYLTHK